MKKIGLYFGTFNPIHIGHVAIANHFVEYSDLDEVWFVVTPHNPFKQKKSLLNNHHRLTLVSLALETYPKLKESAIEFKLPQPNYTINTLVHLEEKYPNHKFSLLMGEDNLKHLHKWKNATTLLERYSIYYYPRISEGEIPTFLKDNASIHKIDAPIIQISATAIRKAIKENKNFKPLVPIEVYKYIDEMNFYK